MATARMTLRTANTNSAERRLAAFMRLQQAERSDEMFPVLLEEIIALGYPRAVVLLADHEDSVLAPRYWLQASRSSLERYRVSLYAVENPLIQVMQTRRAVVVPSGKSAQLAYLPIYFQQQSACVGARDEAKCLAVVKGASSKSSNDGPCSQCGLEAFRGVLAVELRRGPAAPQLDELVPFAKLVNSQLSRLLILEHAMKRGTELEATISHQQAVLASMSEPVVLTDNQHRVLMQNKAAERFFNLPDAVSEGRARAVELNNLLFSAALSSMAASGVESSRDLTLVDAIEGEEVLFEAVSAPTALLDGRRTGMVTVLRDVTDLRRADEELRLNYEKLRAAEEVVRQDRDRLNLIIENVGDPIVVCDRYANYVLLDPLATELFGNERETFQGTSVRMRNQAKLDAYIAAFTYSFSDRENASLRLVHPVTGMEIEYDAHSGKIYDERGQVAYTVTVLRDLSAMRRMEQLKMERRMLEMEKFAAAGRLAGTIAHEVNNPLEAIKNCIFLLQDAVQPDSQPVYEILKTETERVARIVRQMLGLYRNTEQVTTVDVNAVIEDTLLLFSRQLDRSGIRVDKQLGNIPESVGSGDQIRQVLSNLIVNARDSMSQGGVLYVKTRLLSKDGVNEKIRILVGDTGCGIPRQMLGTMFEPFVTTKGERGTGLGLWIVKGIIENHGGKLRVRSVVGKGTVFKIELPVVR